MFYFFKGFIKTSSTCLQLRNNLAFLNSVKRFSDVGKNYYKHIFENLDSNKDGIVNKNDLRKEALAMFLYTLEYDDESLDKAFRRLDKANKGSVNYEDVETYLKSIKLPSEEILKSEFKRFDLNNDGAISFEDMVRGYGLSKGDTLLSFLQREFKMMGKNEHGEVTLEEYIRRNYYKYFLASVFQVADILASFD